MKNHQTASPIWRVMGRLNQRMANNYRRGIGPTRLPWWSAAAPRQPGQAARTRGRLLICIPVHMTWQSRYQPIGTWCQPPVMTAVALPPLS